LQRVLIVVTGGQMIERIAPREIVKGLLQGIPQPRPLIVPIVFSLGAKVENLSHRAYLENPTKISNAMRQIRAQLRTDGVACYFDSFLELEALGLETRWDSLNQTRAIDWPGSAPPGELPPQLRSDLRSPEEAANSAPVRAGVEVIRRLNSILRDEPLLMAGVSGSFTLAARLTQLSVEMLLGGAQPSESALELAAAAITKIVSAFVESGANLIFVREEFLPQDSPATVDAWAASLGPAFNIVRFYGALPVLQFASSAFRSGSMRAILEQPLDATICLPSPALGDATTGRAFGLSFPIESMEGGDVSSEVQSACANCEPALVTTDGDVPVGTDLKRLMSKLEFLARGGN
jgi:uroporphyrinogen decarboxylase-like protein